MDLYNYIQECGSILNTMPDTVLLLDKQGKIVFVNEASLKKYGYDKKDMVGKSFLELDFISDYSKKVAAQNMAKRLKGEQVKPCASIISLEIASPNPVLFCSDFLPVFVCLYLSKIMANSSAGMPAPVSDTLT